MSLERKDVKPRFYPEDHERLRCVQTDELIASSHDREFVRLRCEAHAAGITNEETS